MKIAGGILIFIFVASSGVLLAKKRKDGVRECAAFLELMKFVRDRIAVFETPTKLIFGEFENATLEDVGFLGALRKRGESGVYYNAFSDAFDAVFDKLSMTDKAKKTVLTFGGVVGKSDSVEQLGRIDGLIDEMKEIIQSESASAARDSKMYVTLGLSVGAAIFILLI